MILFLTDMILIQQLKLQWPYRFNMVISHLVALSNNFVIGVNNALPWRLKNDLQHFSAYTQNKAIIMGRKTFESIGRALPNRKSIIISSNFEVQDEVEIIDSLEGAIQLAKNWNIENNIDNEVIIIGGGRVFRDSMAIINKLVLTRVDCNIEGDIFYPEIDLAAWKRVEKKSYIKDAGNEYNFLIETYLKS